MRKRIRSRFVAILCAALVTVPSATGAQAPTPPRVDNNGVTITGRRMPAAEAPSSATCEAMARDPFFRALLVATGGDLPLLVPTRMPRNPDYRAPPLVPAGSPLPELPKSRFAVQGIISNELMPGSDPSVFTSDGEVANAGLSDAIDLCRSIYQRGGDGGIRSRYGLTADDDRLNNTSTSERGHGQLRHAGVRAGGGRAVIAWRDTTLPTAFLLFDQGRYAEALDWFRKAERKLPPREGGDEAMLFIGKILLQGLGERSDPAAGVKWLKKTATLPFNPVSEMPMFNPRQPDRNTAVGEAAIILGNIYRNGFGAIAKDPEECRKWLTKAYAVGHISAAAVLGDIYYLGIDTPRDVEKAASYYKKAATYDHPAAQVAYADILRTGEGVKADPGEAIAWYNAAARHDYAPALFALGRAYDFGQGVPPDQAKAIGFYKEAAIRGDPAAANALGTFFYQGSQVARNEATARGWFEAAAKSSSAEGMFNLAAMYARGEGGERDVPQAWAWLNRAAQAGHETAPRALAALERRMSPAERAAGASVLTRP